MAPKRRLQDPPPAVASASSSSSEEDEVEEESENDAAEDEVNGVPDGTDREDGKSDGEAEDESETESDNTQPSPSVSDFTIKPIASKPINDLSEPLKHVANNNSAHVPATIVAAGASKRANESSTEKKESRKKKKRVKESQDEDSKKESGGQRLWNEDDEIAILNGMVDYHSKRGVDPCSELSSFYEYMKNKIHADVSKMQLVNKIRSLKRKFQTNAKKGENGEGPVFSKSRDQVIFELSKKVWEFAVINGVYQRKPVQSKGKSSSNLGSPKREMAGHKDEPHGEVGSPKREMAGHKDEPHGEVNAMPAKSYSTSSILDGSIISGRLSLPESDMDIVKEAMSLIGSSKAKELERRVKELQKDELLLHLKRVELIHDSAKLALDVLKFSM